MKIVHWLDGDPSEGIPIVDATDPGDDASIGELLVTIVGVGNAYYAFQSLPAAIEANLAWNPDGAPVCSAEADENQAAVEAMLASPPLSKVWAAA